MGAARFVYVSGDAYVDHPSFGAALITRVLEAAGFKVAMLSQPDWHNTRDFIRFGRPRLGFLVSSGNIDSMVAHYTAAKKKEERGCLHARREGRQAARPCGDRLLPADPGGLWHGDSAGDRRAGGLPQAVCALRLLGHDAIRPSILLDSGADLRFTGWEKPSH